MPNRFELHVSDNHVWQITLRNLAIATVAVINDVPEAKEWLTYMYEVWSARFPVLGTTDGGWHEGNGYFRVNFKSIIYLSQMFGDFSGVDYFKLPWMQNLPYYMLYTHPNGAASTAIGDMWENIPYIVKGEAWFADALTYRMNDPYLNWYVSEIKRDYPSYYHGTDDFLFFRLLNYKPNRNLPATSPSNLAKSRKFGDVGVVAMHERTGDVVLDRAGRDVQLDCDLAVGQAIETAEQECLARFGRQPGEHYSDFFQCLQCHMDRLGVRHAGVLRLDRQGFKVGLLDATTSSAIDQQAPRRRRQERPRLLDGVGFCQAEHTDEGVMGQIGRAL